MICRLTAFAVLLAQASTPDAFAETVTGTIELPPIASRKAPPVRGRGFVPRTKNTLVPTNGHDPRPKMVVVLEGGPQVEPGSLTVRYDILGQNFASDILPVFVGKTVELKNATNNPSILLYSKTAPDVVPGEPLGPKVPRSTKAITKAHSPIDVRNKDEPHFLAHIVAFQTPLFSTLQFDGSFSIENVPDGEWTVRLWFDDGFVTNLPETKVTVAKRGTKSVKITLPPRLETKAE